MRTTRSEQRGRSMPAQYRQGDVLLCRVSKVHSGSPVPPDAAGASSSPKASTAAMRMRLPRSGRNCSGAGGNCG